MPKTLKSIAVIMLLFFFSCQKKKVIIQNIQVVNSIDLSIPTEADVIDFSIIDTNTFFALAKSSTEKYEIYKSINGGKSWTQIPFNNSIYFVSSFKKEFQSFEFIDENNGVFVSDKRAIRTYNGGVTWTYVNTPPDPYGNTTSNFIYAGSNGNGQFIFAEGLGNSFYKEHIYKSDYSSTTYQLVNMRPNNSFVFTNAKLTNGKLVYLVKDYNYWENICLSYDVNLNTFDTLYSPLCPSDIYYENNDTYISTFEEGNLAYFEISAYDLMFNEKVYDKHDFYQYHERPYNSIEKINDYFVVVGDQTINTNKSGNWEEIITNMGTGQQENYFKVKKLYENKFIISGEKGLFKKCWFQ